MNYFGTHIKKNEQYNDVISFLSENMYCLFKIKKKEYGVFI